MKLRKKQEKFCNEYLKHYVYELVDPMDNIVFYVGKGKDNRMYDHVKKVKSNSNNQSNVNKNNKIREILNRGEEVIERIHSSFETQEEALDSEMELIAYHGIENLTNVYKKGIVQDYHKYHTKGFVSMVKLLVSMYARIQSMRYVDSVDNIKDGTISKISIYNVMNNYMSKLSESVDRKYFMAILNSEIDKKWTGVSRIIK